MLICAFFQLCVKDLNYEICEHVYMRRYMIFNYLTQYEMANDSKYMLSLKYRQLE